MRKLGIVVGVSLGLFTGAVSFGCSRGPTMPSATPLMGSPDSVAARQAAQTKRVWIWVIDHTGTHSGVRGVTISGSFDGQAFSAVTNARGVAFVDLTVDTHGYSLALAKDGWVVVDFVTQQRLDPPIIGTVIVAQGTVTQIAFYMLPAP